MNGWDLLVTLMANPGRYVGLTVVAWSAYKIVTSDCLRSATIGAIFVVPASLLIINTDFGSRHEGAVLLFFMIAAVLVTGHSIVKDEEANAKNS